MFIVAISIHWHYDRLCCDFHGVIVQRILVLQHQDPPCKITIVIKQSEHLSQWVIEVLWRLWRRQ